MNRETRDKFVSGTQEDVTSGNACWQTAPKVYEKLNHDFGPFDIDLTADESNHLCPLWFGPGGGKFGLHAHDALQAPWVEYGKNGYSNPPYGKFISLILPKAKEEAKRGVSSTFLLPLRITKVFQEHVLYGASELLFCDRRLCFYENGHPRWNKKALEKGRQIADTALFDSIVVRYRPSGWMKDLGEWKPVRVGLWHVPDHT